jgi:hypothetical protein
MKPRVGQWLFASCSAQDYGEIVGVGQDGNGTPTVDIRLEDSQDLIWFGEDDLDHWTPEKGGFGYHVLTRLEVSPGATLILRGVQYRETNDDDFIECFTPGDGCYRCTKLLWLRDQKTPRS